MMIPIKKALEQRMGEWNSMLYRTIGELQDDYEIAKKHECVGFNPNCEKCELIYESEL
jgi:hypothetical protein